MRILCVHRWDGSLEFTLNMFEPLDLFGVTSFSGNSQFTQCYTHVSTQLVTVARKSTRKIIKASY